ncbi:MAG: hypothetical protein ACKV19_24730 [Verrucomicrobiales bacterium]
MVTKFPAAFKTAKSKEEKMKLLEGMKMKMVVVGYDGAVSFPEEPDAAHPCWSIVAPAQSKNGSPEGRAALSCDSSLVGQARSPTLPA